MCGYWKRWSRALQCSCSSTTSASPSCAPDSDGRDPQAAHLDHVVRAALVPVDTVAVDSVAIAREEPLAQGRALGLLVLRPVERQRAVAFHVKVAGFTSLHGAAFVVEDLQLVTGHGFAAGARP